MKPNPGKYCVYELLRPNGDVFYVGKSTGKSRISEHVGLARRGFKGHKYNIIRSVLASGQKIESRIILWTDIENEAFMKECELIRYYGRSNLANETDGGEGPSGFKHSLQTKQILSEKTHINRMGKKHSQETREKISNALKGNITLESRIRIGAASKARNTGKPIAESTKAKLSLALKKYNADHPRPEETRRKIGDCHRGLKYSEETKQKMSVTRKGRKMSDVQRKHVSEAIKEWWANRRQEQGNLA